MNDTQSQRPVFPVERPVGPVVTIYLEERIVTCCMCGKDDDHTRPEDRHAVPIWNGDPTTGDDDRLDGYRVVCGRCYLRWEKWDALMRANAEAQPRCGQKENADG